MRLLKVATETYNRRFYAERASTQSCLLFAQLFLPSFLTYQYQLGLLTSFYESRRGSSDFRLSASWNSEVGRLSSALVNFKQVLAIWWVFRRLVHEKESLLLTTANYLTQCSTHAVVAALLSLT